MSTKIDGKIDGPGGPATPEAATAIGGDDAARALDDTRSVTGPDAAQPTPFARALDAARGADRADAGARAGERIEPGDGGDPASRIAADLDAGAITPEQAVDRLLEAALGDQLPAGLPDAARAELRGMLNDLIRDDPYLAGLAARIGIPTAASRDE